MKQGKFGLMKSEGVQAIIIAVVGKYSCVFY